MSLRLSHVGLSVVDLDRSIAFYRRVFNMRVGVEGGFGGAPYESVLALQGASGRAALLESDDGALQIELFEFAAPAPRPADRKRRVCDHGLTHFCVEVNDIASEYRRMKEAGVTFHCEPRVFEPSGSKATYGRDPDGNVFELWEKAGAGQNAR